MYRYSWLFNKHTDLALFLLPFLIGGLAFVILQQNLIVSSVLLTFLASQFFGLGPMHLGPGWSHFTDPKIFNHVVGSGFRRLMVLAGIVSILLVVPFAYVSFPIIVLSVYIALTIHHLTRQNIGIARLYQNPGQEVVFDRALQAKSINWAAWFFSSLFVIRTCGLNEVEKIPVGIFAIVSLFFVVKTSFSLFVDLRDKQRASGLPVNLSGVIFWGISMLFLSPFGLLGRDFYDAVIIPLVMHWVQYLGLNWILLKRKQQSASNSAGHFKNFLLSSAITGTLVIGLGVAGALQFESHRQIFDLLFGFILALTFVHYLQDAFIWRFSQPVLKESVLSYLKVLPKKQVSADGKQLVGVSYHAES